MSATPCADDTARARNMSVKRIIYAGSEFLTGDDIAAALMRYSAALAEVGEAEMIAIPALADDGSVVSIELLVGPASQIVAMHGGTGSRELVDPDLVSDLDARARRLRPVAVVDPDPRAGMDYDQDV